MTRILFIASLHHPQLLQAERQAARESNQPEPLFPSSSRNHFVERAMHKRGYELAVFWRNLSSFSDGDIRTLQAQRYTTRITPRRVMQALTHRLPYTLNPELRRRNAQLIQQARQFQPDVLWLMGDNTVVHADTLRQLKNEVGCRLLYSCGTSPIVFSHGIEREAARLYDIVVANDYYHGVQWLELGAQQMICLPGSAIDPEFHQPRDLTADEQSRYAADVGFVGTLLPRKLYSERIAALEALRSLADTSGVDVGIWSVHDVPQTLQPFLRGGALSDEMLKILSASKISLNVHGDFMRYGGNMRLFEAAGAGSFQLVDDRPGVREWFTPGEHLVIYDSLDDLRDKVTYYLAHPGEREHIAAAGRAHVLAHHTYEQRLTQLEDVFPL
jgi:spore maturation protein CgeB